MTLFKIAISQRVVENSAYPERRDALSQEWSLFLASILPEAQLFPMPNHPSSVPSWVHSLAPDGIILSGGNNWGDAPERDESERGLFEYSRNRHLPILAVCRGFQVVNLFLGGGIHPRLNEMVSETHVAALHPIVLTDPPVPGWEEQNPVLTVNSFHDQGLTRENLAPVCRPFAISPMGIVEGFTVEGESVLALQWHPERPNPLARDFDRLAIRHLFLPPSSRV